MDDIEPVGICESCSKPIHEGDQYAPCTDGIMLCKEHAPNYSDVQRQYRELVEAGKGDGEMRDCAELAEDLASITARIKEDGDGKVLYVA